MKTVVFSAVFIARKEGQSFVRSFFSEVKKKEKQKKLLLKMYEPKSP